MTIREKATKRKQRYRMARKAECVCRECGKQSGGKSLCPVHMALQTVHNRKSPKSRKSRTNNLKAKIKTYENLQRLVNKKLIDLKSQLKEATP